MFYLLNMHLLLNKTTSQCGNWFLLSNHFCKHRKEHWAAVVRPPVPSPALLNQHCYQSIAKGKMLVVFCFWGVFPLSWQFWVFQNRAAKVKIRGEGIWSSLNRIPVPSAGRRNMGLAWTSPLKSVFCQCGTVQGIFN